MVLDGTTNKEEMTAAGQVPDGGDIHERLHGTWRHRREVHQWGNACSRTPGGDGTREEARRVRRSEPS